TAAGTSLDATWRHCDSERTAWSRSTPASHSGYQRRSATRAISSAAWLRPSCTRTRSRSLTGPMSPRPRLPTAASAIPSGATSRVASSHRPCRDLVTRSTTAARRATPLRPGPLMDRAVSSMRARRSRTPSGCGTCAPCSPGPAGSSADPPATPPVIGVSAWSVIRWSAASQGAGAVLARAHTGDVVHRDRPDLAVTDLAGLRRLDDDVGDHGRVRVVDEDLDADLGDQVDRVLGAAVDLGVALLAAVPAGLADRHAPHARGLERRLHVVETVRLDDSRDELHARTSLMTLPCWMVSYAVSPWTARSMPPTSASSLTRQPSVALRARAITAVTTSENATAMSAMMTWTTSWFTPPP